MSVFKWILFSVGIFLITALAKFVLWAGYELRFIRVRCDEVLEVPLFLSSLAILFLCLALMTYRGS